eukprot:644373-Rhodomonas_salina.1
MPNSEAECRNRMPNPEAIQRRLIVPSGPQRGEPLRSQARRPGARIREARHSWWLVHEEERKNEL